MIISNAIYGR